MAAGTCPACQLRAQGFAKFIANRQKNGENEMTNEQRKNIEGAIFLVLFCLTIPAANWMIGHVGTVCVPQRSLSGAGGARDHGAVRRA